MRENLQTIEFTEERLPNGLRLILSEDHLAPLTAVNLWYDVGSRDELPGRTGFAHLFEHLMFEGSANVPKGEHFGAIERIGGVLNATTWFDRTNYFELVPSHHAEIALWLEADRMAGLLEAVDESNLDRQRAVVKNERRQSYDNRPAGDAVERVLALLFDEGHPYHHAPIGSMADLDAATVDDIHEFFRRHYAPDNVVLSVVGDVDPGQIRGWAESYFGGISPSADRSERPPATLPLALGGPLREEIVDPRLPKPHVHLAYRTPPAGTPEHDALAVGCVVAGTGKGSRLERRLVVEEGLASSVDLDLLGLVGDVSGVLAAGIPIDGIAATTLEGAIHDTLASLFAEPVTEPELARAHGQLHRQSCREHDTLLGRADALSGAATLYGDPGRVNTQLWDLLAVTPERIAHAAQTVFRPENQVLVTYLPEGNDQS